MTNAEELEFVTLIPMYSANKTGLDLSDTIFDRSLTNKRKNKGPSIKP
jgi:hypothetical protein